MNPELTTEQKNQLSKWVVQRDSILLDISNNRVENDKLVLSNKDLAASNTEISDRVQQSIGRIEELKKKEEEFGSLTQSSNLSLVSENSRLQSENSSLITSNASLKSEKDSLVFDIKNLFEIRTKVFESVNGLESMVGGITAISSENATKINNILIAAGEELQKIIEINKVNVVKTNAIINDLPVMIFNLQRDIIERKRITKVRTP